MGAKVWAERAPFEPVLAGFSCVFSPRGRGQFFDSLIWRFAGAAWRAVMVFADEWRRRGDRVERFSGSEGEGAAE